MMTKKSIFIYIIFMLLVLSSCEKNYSHPYYIEGDGLSDAEGNTYKSAVIGNQEWMAENLKTDLYCNGDSIQYSGADVRVKVYDNDLENEAVFGKLYNYQAVLDTSGLCPCDWHIPTELEFAVLINYLGGYKAAMRKMKSSGTIEAGDGLWKEREPTKTYDGNNLSGFSALPAGIGFYTTFMLKDSTATFWALPTEGNDAIEFSIGIHTHYVEKIENVNPISKEVNYYSIRCIKNL
jgi:uncharacterized protein (TIGR02145 family)